MRCRARRILLVISSIMFCGAAAGQELVPDSLLRLGAVQLANGNVDSAEVLFRQAQRVATRSAGVALALGRVALERGNKDEATHLFKRAEEWEPRKGYKQYGEGLIALRDSNTSLAKTKFQDAYRRNHRFADALYQVARIQAEGFVDRFSAKRTYRRTLELDPQHPSANVELGKLYDESGDVNQAIDCYEAQMRVNPANTETMERLGYALLEKGLYWHARQRLYEALQNTNGREAELTLAIATTYMGDRQFAQAHDAYAQAFQLLPEEERAYYEDITEVSSPQEAAYFARISGEQRMIFLRKFWLRRDPTPITLANERMMEHFRRVWYARKHFSKGHQPWDDRGSVYIRYGEPDNRSTSAKPNFSTSRDVDVVRDKYMNSIYGTSPPEVIQQGSLPVYPLVDPDEMSATASSSNASSQTNQSQSSTQSDDESSQGGSSSTTISDVSDNDAQSKMFSALGLASLTKWEEWTYIHVNNGLRITFVDRIGRGDYQFATPPPTSNLQMASVLQQFAPEEQVRIARIETPDQYVYNQQVDPLNFYYYVAQFRARDQNQTEVDIYYGLPTSDLMFQELPRGGYRATVESGFAVFDTLWNVKGRVQDRTELVSPERPNQERGSIHVDARSMLIDGGQRILLSVQAEDLVSGRLQAYQENVTVARYDTTRLGMSDIVVAGMIRKADSTDSPKFVKNGLYIVPMASRSFRRVQPVHVYFEIYNLTRGEEFGDTEYEVEHAVRVGTRATGNIFGTVGRILGGSGRRVGISRVMEGIRAAEFQNFRLDTSTMSGGEYTLIITVKDLKSDQRVTRERVFRIGD